MMQQPLLVGVSNAGSNGGSNGGTDSKNDPAKKQDPSAWLGDKTITAFGSFALIFNNISGPGMLAIPRVFIEAGWLVPCVVFAAVCVTSTLAATMLSDAMARVEGNERFDKRVEFTHVFEAFLGRRTAYVSMWLLVANLFSLAITSIIDTAQVCDKFFIYQFGSTFALELGPTPGIDWADDSSVLQASNAYIITAGYLLVSVTMAPLGFVNLDENILWQNISFWMLFIVTLVLCYVWVSSIAVNAPGDVVTSMFEAVPMFGGSYRNVIGIVLYNYAMAITVPSWINEKLPSVSVNRTLWGGSIAATVMYIVFGFIGAAASPDARSDILVSMRNVPGHEGLAMGCSMVFGLGTIGIGVPVFCVIMRYNLMTSGTLGGTSSAFLCCVAPYVVGFLGYNGDLALGIASWTGLVVGGAINLLFPFVVSLAAYNFPIKRARSWTKNAMHNPDIIACDVPCLCADQGLIPTSVAPLPVRLIRHTPAVLIVCILVTVPTLAWAIYTSLATETPKPTLRWRHQSHHH